MYFLNTPILWLMLIPIFFLFYSVKTHKHTLEKYFSKAMLKKLTLSQTTISSKTRYRVFILITLLFIISLARPVKELTQFNSTVTQPSVVLAMDVSKSMKTTDIYPDRYTFAMKKLKTFVRLADSFNMGILFYAQDAYMLYPLSSNHEVLHFILKDLNITQTFTPNTNLFSALEAGEALLQQHKNKYIVLFTDTAEDVSRTDELSYLAGHHISLFTLATTTTQNQALKTLCQSTNGLYTPYTWGDEDIIKIITSIKQQALIQESQSYTLKHYKEYYAYPLALGLLLLFFLFFNFKKNTLSLPLIVLLCYSMPHQTLHAGVFDFWKIHQAKISYENKAYKQAVALYQQVAPSPQIYYDLAIALYELKEYNQAITTYKKALGEDKKFNAKIYYNIATAYARNNKLDFAKEYYTKSLLEHPFKVAQENLAMITLLLKKQRKNLHKKFQKLHFKAIAQNEYAQENTINTYAIKLHKFIPNEEEQWFRKLQDHHSLQYLQKIPTTRRSKDADVLW